MDEKPKKKQVQPKKQAAKSKAVVAARKDGTAPKKTGRPKSHTDEEIKAIQDAICQQISTTSKSLRQICQDLVKDFDNMLTHRSILMMLKDDAEFFRQYTRAKDTQADLLFDEILEIADDSSLDMAFTEEGKPFIDHEHINRSRLRVDTRKWYLSKIMPKKYGEKLELSGDKDNPLIVEVVRFGKSQNPK